MTTSAARRAVVSVGAFGPRKSAAGDGGQCVATGGAGWHAFGMPLSAATGKVQAPALAVMPDGRPVVSWTEGAPYSPLTYTSVWDGCAWQRLGDPAYASSSALLVTPPGQIIRATVRPIIYTSDSFLVVERWNGTSFEAMGNPIQPLYNNVGSPVMVADVDGNPILAWVDAPQSITGNSTVQVAHWNGSTWSPLSDASGVVGSLPRTGLSMALTPAGQPVLAWATTSYASVVAQFVSGTSWTKLGTPPAATAGSGTDHGPIVRINSAGIVFLAWEALAGAYHVAVSRFDGTSWQPMGGPLVSTSGEIGYGMAIDQQGLPLVADSEVVVGGSGSELFTYHWDGSSWQPPAPPAGAVGGSMYFRQPDLLIDPMGRLVAGWIVPVDQRTGTGPFVVLRFDP